jgi:1-deoxy-D-xylulose 5-phosphate reductoisomerase
VAAFLQRRIGFLTIAQVAGEVLDDFLKNRTASVVPESFEAVYEIDRLSRELALKKLRLAA